MARSLNKVTLIGNLTRDPELRYTPQGTAVCTFGLATNRQWITESGEKKEEAEFHRIVAWNKLAELCAQLLAKGRKVYVEGRLQTRRWTGQDGQDRLTTEIVISDMIILDSRGEKVDEFNIPEEAPIQEPVSEIEEVEVKEVGSKAPTSAKKSDKSDKKSDKKKVEEASNGEENEEDIPF